MRKLIESAKPISQPGVQQENFAGEWVSLHVRLPGCNPRPIGIMLWEGGQSRCHVELDEDWLEGLAENQDADIWFELGADLEQRACEMGPQSFIEWLESCASHTFFIGPRQSICVPILETVAHELYRSHISRNHHDLKPARTQAQCRHTLFSLRISAWNFVAKPLRWAFTWGTLAALFLVGLAVNYKQPTRARHTVHFATIKDTKVPAFSGLEVFPTPVSLSTLPNLVFTSARTVRRESWLSQTPKPVRKRLNPAHFSPHIRPRTIYIAACPYQPLPVTNSVDALPIVLPSPPQYRNRDNHLVHFFGRLASPVKKLIVQN